MNDRKMLKATGLFLALALALTGTLVFFFGPGSLSRSEESEDYGKSDYLVRNTPEQYTPDSLFSQKDMDDFASYVNSLWFGKDLPEETGSNISRLDFPAQAVYIALRSKGRRPAEIWETRGTTRKSLNLAINLIRDGLTTEQLEQVDTLEIALAHTFMEFFPADLQSLSSLLSDVHRGMWGLEIVYDDQIVERYSPTYVVASNRSHTRLIELFREEHGISEGEFTDKARVYAFQAEQILVMLGEEPKAYLMERGNTYVHPDTVNRERTARLGRLAGNWLVNNVHDDGRMTYKYWPSSASESTANNMIRQWMASVALTRYGIAESSADIIALAGKNIDYNLQNFYYEENGYGLIEEQGQVKLGAVALAALAILEHPERQRWAAREKALQKTIDSLWNEDGSLTSFYIPEGDMRFQNFYPGEALLYWAMLYERELDPLLLEKFMKSFDYYRSWHLEPENRNPAFIPWHTQAYYTIWKLTGHEPLREFIFEMNDWLLTVQQWPDDPQYRDTLGRFYDPDRPFGPPHSSSTGVYLEGLIDAFELAREAGDQERMESYRQAINRGLRSVMQLQFVDKVDMFYISPPMYRYVKGGIRTTVYNNEIRCDNVQHNLMAVLKILDTFEEGDFLGW
jgi:hypothetical protein